MEENPDRENLMKVWKDYTIEDDITVREKAKKAIKLKTNFCQRKLCLDVMHDFTGFTTETIKEIIKEIEDMAKRVRDKLFQDMGLGEVQELINATPKKFTEVGLMEMHASETVPDDEEEDVEEAVPENKLTLDNLAEGF